MKIKRFSFFLAVLFLNFSCNTQENKPIRTEITKWQYGKNAAVSLTYDDGSINQFRKALPIMNKLRFPATFYIVTGNIPESKNTGKFIGRPVEEIIKETENTPTNKDNFFERASAVGFLGYEGTVESHTMAGQLYEQEKFEEAYQHIDEAYEKVRKGAFKPKDTIQSTSSDQITWEEIKEIARQGHEFGSHTVTHPRLAVLDEDNMMYELEKKDPMEQKMNGPWNMLIKYIPL
jgi:peptidoglycan/xylan/chitin deacetylase (PgdA/CDA1 family)